MAFLRRLAAAAAVAALFVMTVLPSPAAAQGTPAAAPAPPYKNHTVGGAGGWIFNTTTNSTAANYSSWAATQSFFLGDYLIFKTNDNSTVVHTANATTYGLCDASDDDSPDTFIYGGGGGGGGGLEEAGTIAVPLTFEGANYFFSDADGGVQCTQGMRFEIRVGHGRGLPPALAHPPPSPRPRVLAPPPDDSSAGFTSPEFAGGGGGGPNDKSGASRAVGRGSSFVLGVALGVGLAIFSSL